jgi:hypothetical protein
MGDLLRRAQGGQDRRVSSGGGHLKKANCKRAVHLTLKVGAPAFSSPYKILVAYGTATPTGLEIDVNRLVPLLPFFV